MYQFLLFFCALCCGILAWSVTSIRQRGGDASFQTGALMFAVLNTLSIIAMHAAHQ